MPDTQSVQCGGNGCFIVQVQGDGNTVVSGLTLPELTSDPGVQASADPPHVLAITMRSSR